MHPLPHWQDVAIKAFMYLLPLWMLVLGILLLSGDANARRALRWMLGRRRTQAQYESLPIAGRRQLFMILGVGFVLFATVVLVEITRAFTRNH